MSEAVLHIGLPKTGTSYVQESLVRGRDALAVSGVEVLNVSGRTQHHAAWDLLGRRIGGAGPGVVEGAWTDLARRAVTSEHATVLYSDEFLVHARRSHVRTVRRSLGPRELRVVITVRDLRRAVTSMWEQNTAKGRSIRWSDYVAAVRDPSSGLPTSGVAFWLRYDVRRIATTWADVVGSDSVMVVVVPRPGSPAPALMQRFGQATGIDLTGCRPPHHHVHSSLGAVQIEVLRRLNPQLRDQLSEAQYLKVVAELFRPAGAEVAACARPAFPQEHRDWLEETSAQLIDWLATGPYAVIGDLDDLRPDWSREEDLSPDDIADEVIDEATRQLLLGTLTSYGLATSGRGKRRRHHQESLRSVGDGGNPRKRLIWTSRLRATAFGVKVWLLERADRNRVLARLAAHSVRRTRRR